MPVNTPIHGSQAAHLDHVEGLREALHEVLEGGADQGLRATPTAAPGSSAPRHLYHCLEQCFTLHRSDEVTPGAVYGPQGDNQVGYQTQRARQWQHMRLPAGCKRSPPKRIW